jgi:FKBP-type peptidyl-prolyl cis-trans isomerase SlpA
MEIAPGTKVTLQFSLALTDDTEIDSTFGKAAAEFSPGDGSFLPGFEAVLMGLKPGARQRFELPPEQAFGPGHQDNLRMMPLHQFGTDITPEPGLMVSFQTPDGELPGVVRSLEGDLVIVDFNHPLAGRTIVFDVEILDVQPA